jgi:outer membrane protein assembly factor BamB
MSRTCLALVFCTLWCGVSIGEDWPQWMGPHRDDRWNETGTIDAFPAEGAKVLWRTPVNGGYSGPAVVEGKVYVFDYLRGTDKKLMNNPGLRTKQEGQERVLCLDAKTGEKLWEYKYPCTYTISYASGPRCTPTVADGMVYALGAEGNFTCLDANTGSRLWAKELKKEYNTEAPIWGFCSHPLVDGNKVICGVGGKGSTLVAFDKKTGKEIWKAVSAKEQGYCPPMIYEAGGQRQLIHWNAENISSVDPETGKVFWEEKLPSQFGMSIMSPRKEGDLLFTGAIGFASICLKLDSNKPAETVAWKGDKTKSICPVNSTPILENGYIYGVDQPGQLRCVELKTGKRLWESYAPTTGVNDPRKSGSGTAFLIKNGDKYFIMSETGHLIIAKLTPEGYQELSRAKILDQTNECFGRDVVWSHPAFANKCCFARNDKEIVCVSLAKE